MFNRLLLGQTPRGLIARPVEGQDIFVPIKKWRKKRKFTK